MDIEKILSQMTLEEKAALCQGKDFWHLVGFERLGVPEMMVSDGPHGLRKQDLKADHLGVNESIKAVCFPTAVGTAASFDRDLLYQLGEAIGESAQAEDLGVVLGPAANIKRSPLCGRNFEYFSEDPYLSAQTAAAYIRGVQSKGVGTSLKHFAANNQEARRMSISAEIRERALREIYLASFEGAVKEGKPWTLMCSYNKINGVYSSQNPWLLNDVLRKEWGFDGMVMTDWGACDDHALGVASGLDLEMPRAGDADDAALVKAVREGRVSEEALDTAVRNLLKTIDKYVAQRNPPADFDWGVQHHQARKFAREAMVLLKNDGNLLPITGNKKVAFIGGFAEKPRFQGGGSSHINCTEILSALEAVRAVCPVTYAEGFSVDDMEADPAKQAEAVKAAAEADIAVLFLGLNDRIESEGYDRRDMKLPPCQEALVAAVTAVQPNVAVVLHNGSPVELPWADSVPAILEAYLGGQASGGAVVDLLFGAVSPCGKLAETFPMRLEDTPSYLDFPGETDKVYYGEGIYVGYRWYDKRKLPVRFPFGHGLTYTTFEYSNLRLSAETFDGGELTASVDVTNTGKFAAKEIVQFYIRPDHPGVDRPVRELKGYGKIALAPGETGTVTVTLDRRSFAYWEERIHDWVVEGGRYVVEAAASSRDIRLCAPVEAAGETLRIPVTGDTIMSEIRKIPGARKLLDAALGGYERQMEGSDTAQEAISQEMAESMSAELPLHALCSFDSGVSRDKLMGLVEKLNALQGL